MMKRLACIAALSVLFFACSSSDSQKDAVLSVNDENNEQEMRQKDISVELLSVDTCFAHFDYENPTMSVESFVVKRTEDSCYTVRVLGNAQCPPAEKPDYLEYSFKGDTLSLNIDKKDRLTDVTCSCMYWADVLIRGDVTFNKIQINGNIFTITKE
jgi:hypothetical protein